jgi:hypothetical protein
LTGAPPTSSPPPGAKPLWGSHKGAAAPGAVSAPATEAVPTAAPAERIFSLTGGEPLDPLSQKLMTAVRLLSLLLLLVVANSFLHSEENPLNPIAAAAERTQTEPGARYTMKAIYTAPELPRPMVAHGHGAYNSETGLEEAWLQVRAPKVGRVMVEAISDGTTFYMRGGKIEDELPPGKEWLAMQPLLGQSEQSVMSGAGADSSLQMLESVSGGVRRVGAEKVRGVPTRRFRAGVTLDDIAGALRDGGEDDLADLYEKYATVIPQPITLEASIDRKGIVRRSRMVMALPAEPGQPTLTMDMRMELFDFGARPKIDLPDPARVFDATPLFEEQLDSL